MLLSYSKWKLSAGAEVMVTGCGIMLAIFIASSAIVHYENSKPMSNKSKTNTLAVNDNIHSLVFRIHLNPISSDRQCNKKSFVLYDSCQLLVTKILTVYHSQV